MSKDQKEDQLNPIITELTTLYKRAADMSKAFCIKDNVYDKISEGYEHHIHHRHVELTNIEEIITDRCKTLEKLTEDRFKTNQSMSLEERAADAYSMHEQLEKLDAARGRYKFNVPIKQGGDRLWHPAGKDLESPYNTNKDIEISTYVLIKSELAKPDFNKDPVYNMAMLADAVTHKIATYDELYENKGHARIVHSDNAKMIGKEVGVFIRKCMKEESKGFGKAQDVFDFFIELKLKIKKAVGLINENEHIGKKLGVVETLLKKHKEQDTQPKAPITHKVVVSKDKKGPTR